MLRVSVSHDKFSVPKTRLSPCVLEQLRFYGSKSLQICCDCFLHLEADNRGRLSSESNHGVSFRCEMHRLPDDV